MKNISKKGSTPAPKQDIREQIPASKTGRKRLPASKLRSVWLPVRVNGWENAQIRKLAAAEGETISHYVRSRLDLPVTGVAAAERPAPKRLPVGRSKAAQNEKRKLWLPVRVSADETALVTSRAQAAGVTVAEYVRTRIGLPSTNIPPRKAKED